MVSAFVLINVEDRKVTELLETLQKVEGVKEVHLVAGEYDMVAVVTADNNDELSKLLTDKIIHIPGIKRTKTLISLRS
ncbi:MAG: Lrp/AsnC family transcriptional regulator [Lentisphaeria bacterium]